MEATTSQTDHETSHIEDATANIEVTKSHIVPVTIHIEVATAYIYASDHAEDATIRKCSGLV